MCCDFDPDFEVSPSVNGCYGDINPRDFFQPKNIYRAQLPFIDITPGHGYASLHAEARDPFDEKLADAVYERISRLSSHTHGIHRGGTVVGVRGNNFSSEPESFMCQYGLKN